MKKRLPSISIVVPTYNEEENILKCLESIFKQDYPQKLLEVLIVDNYSTDKTLYIAKQFPIKIIMSKIKNNHVSKMIALHKAKGELFYYMDADLEFKYTDYLKRLVKPLLANPLIVGASGKVVQIPDDVGINRYLTHELHQRDPVLEYFSPSIMSTVIENNRDYYLCKYSLEKIPPIGRCLFWRSKIMQTPIPKLKKFIDLDVIAVLVECGFCYFAFVPKAEEYHRHVKDLGSLITKRLRNIDNNYIPHYKTRHYKWFNLKNNKDIVKIILWLIYANLIFPALIRGLFKSVKYRDIWCIWYEPVLTLLLTDITIYGFLHNAEGRKFLMIPFQRKTA